MIKKPCDQVHDELLPGYALHALDPLEHREAAAHVEECPECRSEAEQMAEALHLMLGQAVAPAVPSPLLRTQFLARVALELGPTQAAGLPGRPAAPTAPLIQMREPAIGAKKSSVILPPWLMGATAVPAVLAVVLAIVVVNMKGQLDDQRNHVIYNAIAAPHVAMALSGPAVSHGMTGEVIVPKQGSSGLVIVSGLPHPSNGMAFTCWVHRNGRWTADGSLQPDASGLAMVALDRDMNLFHADKLGISLEPAGQVSQTPSSPMMLSTPL